MLYVNMLLNLPPKQPGYYHTFFILSVSVFFTNAILAIKCIKGCDLHVICQSFGL